jgi:hypothetical protein
MNKEAFATELNEFDISDLRKKAAKEYGIKLLPEYTKADIINLIVNKASGNTKFVTDTTPLEQKNEKTNFQYLEEKTTSACAGYPQEPASIFLNPTNF